MFHYRVSDVVVEVLYGTSDEMTDECIENERIEQHFGVVVPVFQKQLSSVVRVRVIKPQPAMKR